MSSKDYYTLLGVEREASPEEIKKAFRKKAVKCHPDRDQSEDAAEQFRELREAYEVLSDPVRRREYDLRFLNQGDDQFIKIGSMYFDCQAIKDKAQATLSIAKGFWGELTSRSK